MAFCVHPFGIHHNYRKATLIGLSVVSQHLQYMLIGSFQSTFNHSQLLKGAAQSCMLLAYCWNDILSCVAWVLCPFNILELWRCIIDKEWVMGRCVLTTMSERVFQWKSIYFFHSCIKYRVCFGNGIGLWPCIYILMQYVLLHENPHNDMKTCWGMSRLYFISKQ